MSTSDVEEDSMIFEYTVPAELEYGPVGELFRVFVRAVRALPMLSVHRFADFTNELRVIRYTLVWEG